MSLKDRINDDMNAAMRARDAERLSTIRMLLAAIKQRVVDERVVLDDAAVVGIVDKLIKQRRDSIAAFQAGGRADLVAKESAEVAVLEAYLPARLSADEVAAEVFGSRVNGGVYGPNPDFTRVDSTGDFIYDIDFRQLYASILGAWFGAGSQEMQTVLLRQFTQLPIINGATGVAGEDLPVSFALRQNYPNPFNPSTTIEYDVAEESFVTVTVFNELGQEVRQLERGVRQRGRHTTVFDAAGLASGVYFYRLTAGGFAETRRMMLVR